MFNPKVVVGAISFAFGAVSLALAFFAPVPSGICGLIAGVLGLAIALYHDQEKANPAVE